MYDENGDCKAMTPEDQLPWEQRMAMIMNPVRLDWQLSDVVKETIGESVSALMKVHHT